ncbi:UEV-domain-containing protein [Athelia psychrophila]|uniref:UEV-domain-containing protein n=1 Tax=Athelia psychrophila TaxID=1759441 RepID=A0A166JDB7_9AGAM|nr:UEV-domain-containing protein [Fibularhizoctonia sp. CBS 109695]
MSSSESLTQKWLRQNVQSYAQKDRVYADIDSALARYQTLRPKSDVYTYDDGRTQLLLCVHGLLPITFRQASYNIPIAIWITREHPRVPPIAYVVPTTDMLVKAGKHVEHSGRCHVEYVQHWERKSEACNISGLLEAMQDQFSREPPVYAKPKNAPGRAPSAQIAASGPTPSPVTPSDRPLLPPKPGASAQSAVPQRPPGTPTSPGSFAQPLSPSLATRPPPPLPPTADARPPQYIHPTVHADNSARNASTSAASPPPSHLWNDSRGNLPVYQPSTAVSPPPLAPQYSAPPPPPPPPPPQQTWAPPVQHHQPQPNFLDEESEGQYPPPVSSTAPLPPRPPNPELQRLHAQVHSKLNSELASLSQAMVLDAERLRAHQADLLAGEPAIHDEMARLQAVRDVCRTVSGRMRGTVEQGERNVAELKRKGDPEVDELVCSTTIVHNQLINLVAEDNAIEDTIYHLHRALNTGRVDLDRFLRTTRVLAEEQFMKRALIEKIQAGVPMGTMSRGSNWP